MKAQLKRLLEAAALAEGWDPVHGSEKVDDAVSNAMDDLFTTWTEDLLEFQSKAQRAHVPDPLG